MQFFERIFILLAAGTLHLHASSQAVVHPGGVHGAIRWYVTDSVSSVFKDKLKFSEPLLTANISSINTWLNFHPSLVLTASDSIRIRLSGKELNSASFFTVYKPTDTARENIIWHLRRNEKTNLVLTTNRMADLESYSYMNYIDLVKRNPKVNIYIQHKEKATNTISTQLLLLGNKPSFPQLPIRNFSGMIPELIIYDRPLGSTERLRVASYLAIKYAITLTEPGAVYLSSAGTKIWNGEDYSDYHNNIAGIGRDDSTGLLQKKATSSNEPELLTVSINDTLADNRFMLWGNNDLALAPDIKMPGTPMMLQKKWMFVTGTLNTALRSRLAIDTRTIDATLPDNPVYWLAIDRSGTGKFNQVSTEYLRMSRLLSSGIALFDTVKWHTTNSNKEVMAIVAAQDLLVSANITEPTCRDYKKGNLAIRIHSGVSPYQVVVKNFTANVVVEEKTFTPELAIPNAEAGRYTLKVTDSKGLVYEDAFYINNTDAPKPSSIETIYSIRDDETLLVDASKNMDPAIAYSWQGPDVIASSNPILRTNKAGTYTLQMTKDNCRYEQEILVRRVMPDIFAGGSVIVYPNPSPDLFKIKISLPQAARVNAFIYDMSGRLVSTESKQGLANYQFSFRLSKAGLYQIVLVSGRYKTSRNILIAR